MREPLNKGAVEVAEAQKALDLFDCGRALPISNALDLYRVHLDMAIAHDHPKIFDLSLGEETFLRLQV
jgi:hypothetical protein